METKVVHCKKEPYDIYIGRPSIFGNPFSNKDNTLAKYKVDTVEEAVAKYKEWVVTQPEIMELIPTLKGKVLGCWCNDLTKCHGSILIKLAEKE